MAKHLVLDAGIRNWAFVPIILATFFVGMIRMYGSQAFGGGGQNPIAQKTRDSMRQGQAVRRARALLGPGGTVLPPWAWSQRQRHLAGPGGQLERLAEEAKGAAGDSLAGMPTPDPSKMMGTVMQPLLMYIPTIGLFMWVSAFFQGSLVARLPLGLNERFRGMLQQGLALANLDVSYVSSFSFYILCFSGLSGVMQLLVSREAPREADPTAAAQAAAGAGGPMPNPLSMLTGGGGGGTEHLTQAKSALASARHTFALGAAEHGEEKAAAAVLKRALGEAR